MHLHETEPAAGTAANRLRRRIRVATTILIAGLVISGATAIPLQWELGILHGLVGNSPGHADTRLEPNLAGWVNRVHCGLVETNQHYPFVAYGTDWLAFGHFVIALFFVGAWRDPVRNRWLFQAGMIACVAVVPYAMLFGYLREIPAAWRCIDASFGVGGFIPLWLAHRWTNQLVQKVVAQTEDVPICPNPAN
ncbi:MAG: hypothetical protein ACYDC1_07090 [Limisphaerales bacterium]